MYRILAIIFAGAILASVSCSEGMQDASAGLSDVAAGNAVSIISTGGTSMTLGGTSATWEMGVSRSERHGLVTVYAPGGQGWIAIPLEAGRILHSVDIQVGGVSGSPAQLAVGITSRLLEETKETVLDARYLGDGSSAVVYQTVSIDLEHVVLSGEALSAEFICDSACVIGGITAFYE